MVGSGGALRKLWESSEFTRQPATPLSRQGLDIRLLMPYVHSSRTAQLYVNALLCLYKAVDLFDHHGGASMRLSEEIQEIIVGFLFDCLSATEFCPREFEEKMMEVIEHVLQRVPKHEKALYCYAKYTALIEYKEDFLENCCKQFPTNYLFLELKADMLCFADKWEEALPIYLQIIEMAPDTSRPSILYALATAHKNLAGPEDAAFMNRQQQRVPIDRKYLREAINYYTKFLSKCEPDHRKRPKGRRAFAKIWNTQETLTYIPAYFGMSMCYFTMKDHANFRQCYALGLEAEKDQIPCFLDEEYPEKKLLSIAYSIPAKIQSNNNRPQLQPPPARLTKPKPKKSAPNNNNRDNNTGRNGNTSNNTNNNKGNTNNNSKGNTNNANKGNNTNNNDKGTNNVNKGNNTNKGNNSHKGKNNNTGSNGNTSNNNNTNNNKGNANNNSKGNTNKGNNNNANNTNKGNTDSSKVNNANSVINSSPTNITNSNSTNEEAGKRNRRKKRKNKPTGAGSLSNPINAATATATPTTTHAAPPQHLPQPSQSQSSNVAYHADVRGRQIRTHHRSMSSQTRDMRLSGWTTAPHLPNRQTGGRLPDCRPIFIEEFIFQEDKVYEGRVLTGTIIEAPNASKGIYIILSKVLRSLFSRHSNQVLL